MAIFLLPTLIFAQGIQNPIKPGTIQELIEVILGVVIKVGLPIVALALVYSGFLFVASRGNEERLKTAKKAFLASVIGAAIILGAYGIEAVVEQTVDSISSTSS